MYQRIIELDPSGSNYRNLGRKYEHYKMWAEALKNRLKSLELGSPWDDENVSQIKELRKRVKKVKKDDKCAGDITIR